MNNRYSIQILTITILEEFKFKMVFVGFLTEKCDIAYNYSDTICEKFIWKTICQLYKFFNFLKIHSLRTWVGGLPPTPHPLQAVTLSFPTLMDNE